jgi:hypothetical protein
VQLVAVNVNICCLLHASPVTVPAEQLTLTVPHSVVAVTAPPNAAVFTLAQVGNVAGLHPNAKVWPQLANVGNDCTVHVNVLVQVAD